MPVELRPIAEAAFGDCPLPSARVDAALPELYATLDIPLAPTTGPQLTDYVYSLEDALVTGWAGAMIKDGLLLTVRPQHNWVAALRAHPHHVRTLPSDRLPIST